MAKYNPNLIHSYLSYRIIDIKKLYKDLKLHADSVRGWFHEENLEHLKYKTEFYVYGAILKTFLINRNNKNKKTLEFSQFRCGKCKVIDEPLNKTITKLTNGRNGSLLAFSVCKTCGYGKIQRPYKKIQEQEIRNSFKIEIDELTILCNTLATTKITYSKSHSKSMSSECIQDNSLIQDKESIFSPKNNSSNQLPLF